MRRRCRSRSGFTLVELLVASVILGVGIVGMAQLYLAAMYTFEKSRALTIATNRVQQEMEYVQSIRFVTWENSLGGPQGTKDIDFIKEDEDDLGVFPTALYDQLEDDSGVSFAIDELPAGEGFITIERYNDYDDILKFTIEATWQGARPVRSPVKIVTLVAR